VEKGDSVIVSSLAHYTEFLDRGIVGEFAGATRTWKLNTYGLTWDQIKYSSDAFLNIASKYGLNIS
jgi:Sep-tRNA:Cys-tRNA synthetase